VLPYGRVPLRPDAWDSLMARRAYEDTEERSDRPRALDKNV